MTSPANAAILDGMPQPAGLHVQRHDGETFVTAGQMMIACYPDGDISMRNVAVAVARQLGFSGQRVAQVTGLTASYVATLHQRALREGAAGLVRPSGPGPKLSPQARGRGRRGGGPPGPARRRSPPGSGWRRPRSAGPGRSRAARTARWRARQRRSAATSAGPWRGARAGRARDGAGAAT